MRALLIAMLFIGALRTEAEACDCAFEVLQVLVPQPGTTLRTDMRVWTTSRQGGVTVNVDGHRWTLERQVALAGLTLEVFVGNDPLGAGVSHQAEVCTQDETCTNVSFITASLDAAPTGARVTSIDVEDDDSVFGSSSCGDSIVATIKTQSADNQIVILDTGADPDLDPFEKGSATLALGTDAAGKSTFALGDPPCSATSWNFDKHDEAPFRVGAFDAAGNFSGWSKRHIAENGCVGAGGGSVLGLLVLLLRRRR